MHQGMQQNISLSRCMQMTGFSHSQQSAIGSSAVQQGRSLLLARRGKGSHEQIGDEMVSHPQHDLLRHLVLFPVFLDAEEVPHSLEGTEQRDVHKALHDKPS